MGPDFTLQSEMVQDGPAGPLHHGSSERTRQGSFQQQRDRYNDYWTLVLLSFLKITTYFLSLWVV